jgi:peptidoglycan/LPS O-acetylase OafA/YrhL
LLLSSPLTLLSSNVFQCAMLFFAGGCTHWLCRQRRGLLVSVGAGAVTSALLASGRINVDFDVILILTVCAVAIFVRVGASNAGSVVMSRLAFLGNATYSSYLLHFPIQLSMVLVVDSMGYSRAVFLTPLMFGTYVALVVGLSPGLSLLRTPCAAKHTQLRRQAGTPADLRCEIVLLTGTAAGRARADSSVTRGARQDGLENGRGR